jgi:methyl-accepting chemotaxis protein
MAEILTSVQRVSDIIGEISAASTEQSQGIGTVNGSVNQLDQMTQQNAALVEQSAAAAESLKEQATRLAAAVAAFKLGSGQTPRLHAEPVVSSFHASGSGHGHAVKTAGHAKPSVSDVKPIEPEAAAPTVAARPSLPKPATPAKAPTKASTASATPKAGAAATATTTAAAASFTPASTADDSDWETF